MTFLLAFTYCMAPHNVSFPELQKSLCVLVSFAILWGLIPIQITLAKVFMIDPFYCLGMILQNKEF